MFHIQRLTQHYIMSTSINGLRFIFLSDLRLN